MPHNAAFQSGSTLSINVTLTHLPIEPTVTNCDISDNDSQLKCVIADVTGK